MKPIQNFQKIQRLSKWSKKFQNCQKKSKLLILSKKIQNFQKIQNVGWVMFPHHSDQMSQRSQVSRVAL